MGGRPEDPRRHRRSRVGHPVGGRRRRPLRWPASTDRPREAPGGRLGRAVPRRADEPPRRRGHPVARRPHQPALVLEPGRARGRDARPVVPRRGVHGHVGGARRRRRALRGRLRGVHPAARRARPAGRRVRAAPAEPGAEGARLAPPRGPGPHEQAEVPHRRGERADRRRPAHPRQPSPWRRRRPRGSARTSSTCSTSASRSATT